MIWNRQLKKLCKLSKGHRYVERFLCVFKQLIGEAGMIEELKDTEIVDKIGGRFRLTALVQKRLQELMEGARPLIDDAEGKTRLEIVIQEILQDKIAVDEGDSDFASLEPGER